jgi:hypothetical protein
MRARKTLLIILSIFVGTLLAQAQDQPSNQPPGAATSNMPDTRPPIGGAEATSVAPLPVGFSVAPLFRVAQSFESLSQNGQYDSLSSISGSISLSDIRVHRRLIAGYEGGGMFTNNEQLGTTSYHRLNLTNSITLRRWTLSAFDSVDYSPESSYGLGGMPVIGDVLAPSLPGGVAPGLRPTQGVLTRSARVSNVVAGQIQYDLSYRNSLTVGGSQGVMRFLENDLQDSNEYAAFVSLERLLSPFNAVGIRYAYNTTNYLELPNAWHAQTVSATFSRRITKRTNAQFSIGPQFISKLTGETGAGQVNWTADATLQYFRNRNAIDLLVSRSTNAGSGVMAGARTTTAQVSISHQLSHVLSAAVHCGYSHNASLGISGGTYNARTFGGQLSRQLSTRLGVYAMYTGQYQTFPGGSSQLAQLIGSWRHTFGFGFDWRPRGINVQ